MNIETGEIRNYDNSMDSNWIKIPSKFQDEAEQLKFQNKSGFESKNLREWINQEKTKSQILKNNEKFFSSKRK